MARTARYPLPTPWRRRNRLTPILWAMALLAGVTALAVGPAASADADGFEPPVTEVAVTIDPAVTTVTAINEAFGTTLVATSSGLPDTYLVSIPAGADAEALADAMAASPGVVDATANTTLTPPEVDQDRVYAWRVYAWAEGTPVPAVSAYALDAIGLPAAHRLSTGSGVVVAVLDTGAQLDHPALAGGLVPGWDMVDGDGVPAETSNGRDDDGDGTIDEGAGHGTHVAGIVRQVAPGARIMPVRVLDDDGSGSLWAVTEGMLWAASHGAQVINASFGTHGSASLLKDAVARVTADGVLVVGAAGNDGKDRRMYPGAADGALAVASVGPGDVASTFTNRGRWVDVVAPGETIHAAYALPAGSYAANSGTSMATPFVSGEAALVRARRPAASPAEVSRVITATATSVDRINPKMAGDLGSGRIDAAAAVASR
ncbi:MAG: S8 family serine peptidase [Acidimicrobiales bacterium]